MKAHSVYKLLFSSILLAVFCFHFLSNYQRNNRKFINNQPVLELADFPDHTFAFSDDIDQGLPLNAYNFFDGHVENDAFSNPKYAEKSSPWAEQHLIPNDQPSLWDDEEDQDNIIDDSSTSIVIT